MDRGDAGAASCNGQPSDVAAYPGWKALEYLIDSSYSDPDKPSNKEEKKGFLVHEPSNIAGLRAANNIPVVSPGTLRPPPPNHK